MRDVSVKVFTAVLDASTHVGVGGDTERRLRARISDFGSWAEWDAWVDFLASLEADAGVRAGGGLRSIGEFFPDAQSLSFLRQIFNYVAGPELLYLSAGRWVGQSLFPEVDCHTIEVGDGRLRQTLTLPDRWRDSPSFFDLMWGALIAAPRLMELSDAHVEMERHERRALYTIVPPPSMTVTARWARIFRMLRTGSDREVIKLFSHMVERLQQANRDVQALWERAEGRNEELRASLAENQRIADALAKAREELEYRIQEQENDPLLARLRNLARRAGDREVLQRFADFVEAIDDES